MDDANVDVMVGLLVLLDALVLFLGSVLRLTQLFGRGLKLRLEVLQVGVCVLKFAKDKLEFLFSLHPPQVLFIVLVNVHLELEHAVAGDEVQVGFQLVLDSFQLPEVLQAPRQE